MKILKDHVIIYDDQCPMCDLYTKAFVDTKMLGKDGRVRFTDLHAPLECNIDRDRACNEIALINTKEGTVTYGIDSLFNVIGHRFVWLWPLFKLAPFRWLMSKLYAFVSYNRKVIAPGTTFEAANSCTPSLRVGYRWAYILFSWLVTSLVLTYYAQTLVAYVSANSFGREFLICGGQIAFQSSVLFLFGQPRKLHYLGHLMTVSLAGALLLVPPLGLSLLIPEVPALVYLSWFGIVVSFMLVEHIRRVKHLGLLWVLSLTWVLYRLMVLTLIIW
ncbi:MAG: DCC1-like thiol-disulfide oxidoreductase family protein [Cyclobacteriaceae bacterium]